MLINLSGKRLPVQTQDPLSWSEDEHIKDFKNFISSYTEQEKNNTNEPTERLICGDDDREELHDVNVNSSILSRATCHLAITFDDGTLAAGTGFFIAPRKVVTAGHCLYDKEKGYAKQIIVRPGLNRRSNGDIDPPFLGDFAADMRVPEDWEKHNNYNHDWGLITLAKEDLYDRAGKPSLQLWAATDDEIRDKLFTLWGYPNKCDFPNQCLFFSKKPEQIKEITPYIVYSIHDVTHGNSGGPLVLNEDIKVLAICSHSYNDCNDGSGFSRITNNVKSTIENYNWP
ncbi:trypsin-like serine protease [Priestia megaterium]|uniref:trypsin-like serine peptidase n=1 Tax=Priestia megaterium TaxID=1404 RepID=UPI002FFFEEAC